MTEPDRARDIADLVQQIQMLVEADDAAAPALREAVATLRERTRVIERDGYSSGGALSHAYDVPAIIEAAIHVSVIVGGALVQNWVARADNKAAQAILRRRKAKRQPTPAQIRDFARFRVNLQWPRTVRPGDDPHAESRGPNSWTVIWVKQNQEFSASGDNDLHEVTLSRHQLP